MIRDEPPESAIAIVGMSGRFAGAPDLESFWRLLLRGGTGRVTYTSEELAAAGVPEGERVAAD